MKRPAALLLLLLGPLDCATPYNKQKKSRSCDKKARVTRPHTRGGWYSLFGRAMATKPQSLAESNLEKHNFGECKTTQSGKKTLLRNEIIKSIAAPSKISHSWKHSWELAFLVLKMSEIYSNILKNCLYINSRPQSPRLIKNNSRLEARDWNMIILVLVSKHKTRFSSTTNIRNINWWS